METLIINADSDNIIKIKEFLKSIHVSYEVKKTESKKGKTYNSKFVKEILDARNEAGGKTIDPNNLWQSLGL